MPSPAKGGPAIPETKKHFVLGLIGPGVFVGRPLSYYNYLHSFSDFARLARDFKWLGINDPHMRGHDVYIALVDPTRDPKQSAIKSWSGQLLRSIGGRREVVSGLLEALDIRERR